MHEPLQHSSGAPHDVPVGRQHTSTGCHGTVSHVAPESGQHSATPQDCPALPQQVPSTQR